MIGVAPSGPPQLDLWTDHRNHDLDSSAFGLSARIIQYVPLLLPQTVGFTDPAITEETIDRLKGHHTPDTDVSEKYLQPLVAGDNDI